MEIRPGRRFQKEFKKLLGRYRSLPEDVNRLEASLVDNPFQGVSLGKGCYKVRMAIESKGQGKSGSARVITLVRLHANRITLLSIYDKSELDSITKARLDELLREEGLL